MGKHAAYSKAGNKKGVISFFWGGFSVALRSLLTAYETDQWEVEEEEKVMMTNQMIWQIQQKGWADLCHLTVLNKGESTNGEFDSDILEQLLKTLEVYFDLFNTCKINTKTKATK